MSTDKDGQTKRRADRAGHGSVAANVAPSSAEPQSAAAVATVAELPRHVISPLSAAFLSPLLPSPNYQVT